MQILVCPHCDLQVAPRSDGECPCCGFNVFRSLTPAEQEQRVQTHIDLANAQQRERANNETWNGCLLIVIGVLITGGTYALAANGNAPTGGFYLALWGPILAGVALLFRGVWRGVFKR